jgi:hypothetical protein
MPINKSHFAYAFGTWLQITLSVFFLFMLGVLLLLPILTILQAPSFMVGNSNLWLLRWQNSPDVGFNITFNPGLLLAIASLLGVIILTFRRRSSSK